MLKQHIARAGERLSQPQINAETQLLRKEIEQGICSAFDQVIEDSTFTHKYAEVINMSPRAIGDHGHEDLLRSLSAPEHGLIFKRLKSNDGLLVSGDGPVGTLPDGFWQFAVDIQTLPPASKRFSIDLTRRNVAEWDRASMLVQDSKIQELFHILKGGKAKVRAIVAADGGLMVIFGIDAHDFESWRYRCSCLREWCAGRGLQLGKFSMHTLIPFSRESRGRGALLYLA